MENRLFVDLMNDFLLVLDVSRLLMRFTNDGNVLLLDQSGVLFVDNRLMVLVDVFLVNNGLVVLMDNVLMVLVHDILLVFNENVLVVLVDDILMDFFHDRGKGVGLSHSSLVDVQHLSTFVEGLHNSLLVMGHNDGLFVDLLNLGLSCFDELLLVTTVASVADALPLDKVGLSAGMLASELCELSKRLVQSSLSYGGSMNKSSR